MRRTHKYTTLKDVWKQLGIEGDPYRLYVEADSDYVHFISNDPNADELPDGAFVEPQQLRSPETVIIRSDA